MTHKIILCTALVLACPPAFAESNQNELERRLGVLAFQTPPATGAAELGPAAGAPKVDCIPPKPKDDAGPEDRQAWARAARECLKPSGGAADLGPAAGVPKVDCMPAKLPDAARIEERLAWTRSVKECLKASIATLQTTAAANPAALGPAVARQNQTAALLADVEVKEDALVGEKDFIGLKWGVGVGYSRGFDDIIDEAEIIDGVVRVKKDLTEQPRVIFEFHNYRWCHRKGRSTDDDLPIKTGCGPFAAVATRDDKVVSGVAAGWMYGWKTGTGTDASGFSIGLGVIVDSGGKVLGDGFKDGEAPPEGATEVLLKEKSVASGVIFFTRTF